MLPFVGNCFHLCWSKCDPFWRPRAAACSANRPTTLRGWQPEGNLGRLPLRGCL